MRHISHSSICLLEYVPHQDENWNTKENNGIYVINEDKTTRYRMSDSICETTLLQEQFGQGNDTIVRTIKEQLRSGVTNTIFICQLSYLHRKSFFCNELNWEKSLSNNILLELKISDLVKINLPLYFSTNFFRAESQPKEGKFSSKLLFIITGKLARGSFYQFLITLRALINGFLFSHSFI